MSAEQVTLLTLQENGVMKRGPRRSAKGYAQVHHVRVLGGQLERLPPDHGPADDCT